MEIWLGIGNFRALIAFGIFNSSHIISLRNCGGMEWFLHSLFHLQLLVSCHYIRQLPNQVMHLKRE